MRHEKGTVIGSASRSRCHSGSHLLHPVVHLHIINHDGELYLQQRPEWKDIQPGKWDTAVGGHVDLGECLAQTLMREAREELNMDATHARALSPYVFHSSCESELINPYYIVTDVVPQPTDELDGGRFWTQREIASVLGNNVFTPNFEYEYRTFILPLLSALKA
ncbi:MAG: NUDIX domain-containing protein [Muribaculaceae bacterium]|nr:NUDIX domain-containing protein [Muribaculaceae bacterium]